MTHCFFIFNEEHKKIGKSQNPVRGKNTASASKAMISNWNLLKLNLLITNYTCNKPSCTTCNCWSKTEGEIKTRGGVGKESNSLWMEFVKCRLFLPSPLPLLLSLSVASPPLVYFSSYPQFHWVSPEQLSPGWRSSPCPGFLLPAEWPHLHISDSDYIGVWSQIRRYLTSLTVGTWSGFMTRSCPIGT